MSTLLVADSDVESVEVIARAAGRLGLRLIIAENGVEALERYRSEQPLVVVVNLLLPVLDGAKLCAKIRDSTLGSVTAIILTGELLRDRGRDLCERLRLSDVLEKPFKVEDMLRALAPFAPMADEPCAPGRPHRSESQSSDVAVLPPARVLADAIGQRQSGELVWRFGELCKSVYLDTGRIIAGTSNGRSDLVPTWLSRDPGLSSETRSRLASLATSGPGSEGWASFLETRAAFARSDFATSMKRWLTGLAMEILRAKAGTVEFVPGSAPATSDATVDASACLFFGLRHSPGQAFEVLLPYAATRIQRNATPDEVHLNHIEQQLLGLADGNRTVGDLLALGRLIQHDVRPLLYGALTLGLAARVTPPTREEAAPKTGVDELPRRGDLGEVHIGIPLAMLASSHSTGILQLRRGDAQTSIHLSDGVVVFARTSNHDFRLGSVLLDTGKIAAEDHARALALQAGQRDRKLGSILLAIGALSVQELHDGLCQQLLAILHDAFQWESGEWVFVEGRLPSNDMVSLRGTREMLLLDCFRSMTPALARRHLPSGDVFLLRTWDLAKIARRLDLKPPELRILELAAEPRRLCEVTTDPGLTAVLLGLLALGCLAASVDEPALPRGGPEKASLATSRADAGADDSLNPTHGEVARLTARCAELVSRVAKLESENQRLRDLLAGDRTVLVG